MDLSNSSPALVPEISVQSAREWLDAHRPGWSEYSAVQESLVRLPYYLKTIYWTERLFEMVRLGLRSTLALRVPGFIGVGVGYHDPANDLYEGNTFGLIVYTSAVGRWEDDRPSWAWQSTDLEEFVTQIYGGPGNLPDELHDTFLELVKLYREGGQLQVVMRMGRETLHGPNTHPDGGVSACYAKSRVGTAEQEGILTAKHVLSDPTINAPVQMADGEPDHTVVDLAPEGIDGALISIDGSFPTGQLAIQPYVAQYLPVEIHTATAVKDNMVTAVTDTYNVWDSPDIPAYLELEKPAKGGDSGSLVVDPIISAAVGLYRGRFDSPSPRATHGRAAHIRQLRELMELELYQ
jgi:hypothetical protein